MNHTTDKELEEAAAFHGQDLSLMREVANDVLLSLIKARAKHDTMNSHHEGYAVILEELDELWDEVKRDDIPACHREALHVAAMGMRFLLDV